MAKTIIKIKTWKCQCGYGQDFEPTQELMDLHFNVAHPESFKDIKENQCPSCKIGVLERETRDHHLTTVTIDDENDLPQDMIPKEKEAKQKHIREQIKKFKAMEHK